MQNGIASALQSSPKMKCILQSQGLSDTCQWLDTYIWLQIIIFSLEESAVNSERQIEIPNSIFSVNFGRLKRRFAWTLPVPLAHLQGRLCSHAPRCVASAFKTYCLEINSQTWCQGTKSPGALDLTELKLCSRELGNYWSLYFNGASLDGCVPYPGSRDGFWNSSLGQWTCWMIQLVKGLGHSRFANTQIQ